MPIGTILADKLPDKLITNFVSPGSLSFEPSISVKICSNLGTITVKRKTMIAKAMTITMTG